RLQLREDRLALLGICFLTHPQPIGVGEPTFSCASNLARYVRPQKAVYLVPRLTDQLDQVADMHPADEVAGYSGSGKCPGEREATHHMTDTNLHRGIYSKNDSSATHSHACNTLNINSARSQSSCVSMSCTRCRGSSTGTEFSLKIGRFASQASAEPQ